MTIKHSPNIFPDLEDHKIYLDQEIYIQPGIENKITIEQEKLLKNAINDGWEKSIIDSKIDKRLLNYIKDKGRISAIDLLTLKNDQNILEIGPGYGQMSGTLAQKTKTVDIIEADLAQAHFCRIRLDQEGVDNVRVIAGGAGGELPYANSVFDGVVMNLVFEWCAIRSTLPHAAVQRAYLEEIARVLKPGGFLFLSTKNRFALRLLTGGRDEHMANMRFGSALPRMIGKALMHKERQHGYLHSFKTLRRMIEGAGFTIGTPYWAIPDMRWPVRYIPFDNASVKWAQHDASLSFGSPRIHWLTKKMPSSWVKYLAPGLVFLARRVPFA